MMAGEVMLRFISGFTSFLSEDLRLLGLVDELLFVALRSSSQLESAAGSSMTVSKPYLDGVTTRLGSVLFMPSKL